MDALALLVIIGVAAAAPVQDDTSPSRPFRIYGPPALSMDGTFDVDRVHSSEILGWRSVYDKPVFLAVKRTDKSQIEAYFAKDGLASVASSRDLRFLHDMLLSGEQKVGIMLSAGKFLDAPELDMKISRVTLPVGVPPSASLGATPWLLIAGENDLQDVGLRDLTLVGDFSVTKDAINVASEVLPPTPSLANRYAADTLGIPVFPSQSVKHAADVDDEPRLPALPDPAGPDARKWVSLYAAGSAPGFMSSYVVSVGSTGPQAAPPGSPGTSSSSSYSSHTYSSYTSTSSKGKSVLDSEMDWSSPALTDAAAAVDALKVAGAVATADAVAAVE